MLWDVPLDTMQAGLSSPYRCKIAEAWPYGGMLSGAKHTVALTELRHLAGSGCKYWPKDARNRDNDMLAACMPPFGRR